MHTKYSVNNKDNMAKSLFLSRAYYESPPLLMRTNNVKKSIYIFFFFFDNMNLKTGSVNASEA